MVQAVVSTVGEKEGQSRQTCDSGNRWANGQRVEGESAPPWRFKAFRVLCGRRYPFRVRCLVNSVLRPWDYVRARTHALPVAYQKCRVT